MKKRILALALSLVLLLSLVPFALAADTAERELWLHLDSRLLRYGYVMADDENEIAVGDVLSVHFQDTAPATLYCNGEAVYEFPAADGEYHYCDLPATKTGTLDLSLKQGDSEVMHRTITVIASKDMYPKVVKRAFADFFSYRPDPFLTSMTPEEIKYAANHGFPFGHPFLPLASIALQFINLFSAIFSFVRIAR